MNKRGWMNRCLTLFGYNMGNIASRRPLLLRFNWPAATIAATLGSCLTCVLLLAGPVHALDPNKRLTQYMHTSWRMQDGSAPTGMYAIAQTSDGFLWFTSGDMMTVRRRSLYFLGWTSEWWFDHERRWLRPDSEGLRRPRRWALGIRVTWDRSPEGSGGHFSVRVGRDSDVFKTSVKILTARFGSCEATTVSQTRPYAMLPTVR